MTAVGGATLCTIAHLGRAFYFMCRSFLLTSELANSV